MGGDTHHRNAAADVSSSLANDFLPVECPHLLMWTRPHRKTGAPHSKMSWIVSHVFSKLQCNHVQNLKYLFVKKKKTLETPLENLRKSRYISNAIRPCTPPPKGEMRCDSPHSHHFHHFLNLLVCSINTRRPHAVYLNINMIIISQLPSL